MYEKRKSHSRGETMKPLNTIKKGCGKLLKIEQGNLSPSKSKELGVGIRCGEKYLKDKVHRRKELINKVIYCGDCKSILEQTEEIIILLKKEFGKRDFLWAVNTESPREVKDRAYKIINKLIGEEKKDGTN